ncbi:hypothetical protein DFH06DRAFT_1336037 [Mycena polygramma]|nr:hypothetical protein DFH06DRAFT_1336037 [Mycena polygramma]
MRVWVTTRDSSGVRQEQRGSQECCSTGTRRSLRAIALDPKDLWTRAPSSHALAWALSEQAMVCVRHQPAPARQTLHDLRRTSLASIRRLPTIDDQIAVLLAKRHSRLYKNEGRGKLYVNARVPEDAIDELHAGNLKPAEFKTVAKLGAKVGHTNAIERRCCQYEACDRGQTHVWAWTYDVPRRYLAERLVHLEIARAGGRKVITRCPGCGVYHREFVAFLSIGSFTHIDRIVWLARVVGRKTPIF